MDPNSALAYLAGIAVRALCLAAAAALTLAAFRRATPGLRHAVWTLVTIGMLALVAISPFLPPLELRVLAPRTAVAPLVVMPASVPDGTQMQLPPLPPPTGIAAVDWPLVIAALYLAGLLFFAARLAFGYLFTRRLVTASSRVRGFFGDELYESTWISVPMTVGWSNPKILLPAGWQDWDAAKLDAVLAHERTHIRRGDWLITLLAGINRCIFWFHPLAWWLERHLGILAEQACDDAALLLVGSREPYAQALLDMAAAVKTSQGRLVWEAMAMAKANEVRKRIERILDDTRQIPRGLNRLGWAALVACSLPLLYLTATVQLAPAQIVYSDLRAKTDMTAGDAAVLEQQLAANPHDIDKRGQLVLYYFSTGQRKQRLDHIFWLVANHPEAGAAAITSSGVLPSSTALNDASDYTRIAGMWKQQVAARAGDARVLGNAAQFYFRSAGNFEEAERLYLAARTLEPSNVTWTNGLAGVYVDAILGATGDFSFPRRNAAFAARVQSQLETSTDALLVSLVGSRLASIAARPQPGRPLPPGTLNLDDHGALVPAMEFGNRLLTRGRQTAGGISQSGRESSYATLERLTSSSPTPATPAPAVAVPENLPTLNPTFTTEPVYPQLARQARIQGDVRLRARIGVDGFVQELSVITGHPLMAPAALEAARQWRFPAQAAPGFFQIIVPFRLPGANPFPSQPVVPGGIVGANTLPPTLPTRIKVGGNVQAARMVNKVDPVYPNEARDAGIRGSVSLNIEIGQDGVIEKIEVTEGHPLLAAAAVAAVRQWRYQPTLLNGNPVSVNTTVTIPFPQE